MWEDATGLAPSESATIHGRKSTALSEEFFTVNVNVSVAPPRLSGPAGAGVPSSIVSGLPGATGAAYAVSGTRVMPTAAATVRAAAAAKRADMVDSPQGID